MLYNLIPLTPHNRVRLAEEGSMNIARALGFDCLQLLLGILKPESTLTHRFISEMCQFSLTSLVLVGVILLHTCLL